jgi:hypothetical protein
VPVPRSSPRFNRQQAACTRGVRVVGLRTDSTDPPAERSFYELHAVHIDFPTTPPYNYIMKYTNDTIQPFDPMESIRHMGAEVPVTIGEVLDRGTVERVNRLNAPKAIDWDAIDAQVDEEEQVWGW